MPLCSSAVGPRGLGKGEKQGLPNPLLPGLRASSASLGQPLKGRPLASTPGLVNAEFLEESTSENSRSFVQPWVISMVQTEEVTPFTHPPILFCPTLPCRGRPCLWESLATPPPTWTLGSAED